MTIFVFLIKCLVSVLNVGSVIVIVLSSIFLKFKLKIISFLDFIITLENSFSYEKLS